MTSTQPQSATILVGDRVRFDHKATSWLARAASEDGRYLLLTVGMFGDVLYTIIDWRRQMRGPMNVIGWGLDIFTLAGPDEAIDEAMLMLRPELPWEPGEISRVVDADDHRGFELSRRGEVPLRITAIKRPISQQWEVQL